MKLDNKVAIITGAGAGLGRASAIMFAKEGAKIVVADIADTAGEETVAAIKSGGGEAIFVHTDVTLASDAENLIKATMRKFGKIDILFNNAGITHPKTPIEDLDESVWDRHYAINVKGIFLITKRAVPIMKKARGGVIINMASVAGLRPRIGSAAYASSKAAVINLTKELALELASDNIRVNCICPVVADTAMASQMIPDNADVEEFKKEIVGTIPLGRICRPEEIAYSALFLASDESAMITGSCLSIDGGRGI